MYFVLLKRHNYIDWQLCCYNRAKSPQVRNLLKCQKYITTHDGSKQLWRKTSYLAWKVHPVFLTNHMLSHQNNYFPHVFISGWLSWLTEIFLDILSAWVKMFQLGLGGLTFSCLEKMNIFLPPGPKAVPGLLTFGQLHVLDHMFLPTFLCSDSGLALLRASHEQLLTPTSSLLVTNIFLWL